MNGVTIELAPDTERKLREKAAGYGKSLESYLEELAEREVLGTNSAALPVAEREISLDEFDLLLDELSEGLPLLPSLPADFSRKDIYVDHD